MSRPDTPSSVAFDPAAPAAERYDANAELSKIYKPVASALIPPPELQRIIDHIRGDLDEQTMLAKAGGQVVPFPGRSRPEPKRGMRSVWLDDLQIFAQGEWYDKPTPLGFEGLRTMVEQTPMLNAIVLTRIRQVSRFCGISEDGGAGFEIRHVDREHQATPGEKESMRLLARFMENSGWEFKPRLRKRLRRDPFQSLMAKLVRDTLTMDSCPIELEWKRDKSLGIDGLYAVDGATIRLCTEQGYEGDDEIYALQVVQGRICTAYTHDQLIYEVRNPRTDVRLAGYGMGETELLVRIVTGFLNALTYNIKGFDENAIPRGLLQLSGDYSDDDLVAFKRYWNAMVKGINNAWTLPVIVSKDAEGKANFERFGIEFNEMYFAKWMTFLTSIACAIYGMSPDEINFESFSAQKSSLSGEDTAEKLADSKDKGLRPLLSFFESVFSDYVVAEFGDKYCFRWVGLDPADQAREWEAKKLVLTVDELRAEKGYEAHPDPTIGGAPLNPSLVGLYTQSQQQQQQPDFGEDDGGPGGFDMEDDGGDDAEQEGQADEGGSGGDGEPPSPAPPTGDEADGGQRGTGGQPEGQAFGKALPSIYTVVP